MTRRRDRNRDARQAALQIAADYRCPDCQSEQTLTEPRPGVLMLNVAHDTTCPAYRAMGNRRTGNNR